MRTVVWRGQREAYIVENLSTECCKAHFEETTLLTAYYQAQQLSEALSPTATSLSLASSNNPKA